MKIFSRKQKPLHEIIVQSDDVEKTLLNFVRSNSYIPTQQDMKVIKILGNHCQGLWAVALYAERKLLKRVE